MKKRGSHHIESNELIKKEVVFNKRYEYLYNGREIGYDLQKH